MAGWSQETKVGLFLLVGILIVVVLIFYAGDFSMRGKETVNISAIFDRVSSGLVVGAPVQMAGVDIGRVLEVRLMEDVPKVMVTIEVEPERVRMDDSACISTMGILGDKYICIIPGDRESQFARTGGNIQGESPIELEQMIKLGENIAQHLDEAISSLNRVFGSPEATVAVEEILENSRQVSWKMRSFSEELAEVLSENRADLRSGVSNMKDASELLKEDLDQGLKDINELIRDLDGIVEEIEEVVESSGDNIGATVGNFKEVSETLRLFSEQLKSSGWLGVMRGVSEKEQTEWPWDEADEP